MVQKRKCEIVLLLFCFVRRYIFGNIYYTGKVGALQVLDIIPAGSHQYWYVGYSWDRKQETWTMISRFFFFQVTGIFYFTETVYDFWVRLICSDYTISYSIDMNIAKPLACCRWILSRAVSSCWQFQDQCWSGWPAFRDVFFALSGVSMYHWM